MQSTGAAQLRSSRGWRFRQARHSRLAYYVRVVRTLVGVEFKLEYSGSALSYLWSLLKPLALFLILYMIFGRLLKLGAGFQHFPLYLLIGLVLWTFFSTATTRAMSSIVAHTALLRRLAFPPLIIPVTTSLSAGITFLISLVPIAVLVAWNRIVPHPDWLLIPLLVLELYALTLAVSLVLATLFVRFRDTGQVWEIGSQLLFYVTPIIYPLELLPAWAQRIVFLNPFTQLMQDVRALILYQDRGRVVTAPDVYGGASGRLLPLAVCALLLLVGLVLFKREEIFFAERT
jgi:ABC-2 type transport system permease protein